VEARHDIGNQQLYVVFRCVCALGSEAMIVFECLQNPIVIFGVPKQVQSLCKAPLTLTLTLTLNPCRAFSQGRALMLRKTAPGAAVQQWASLVDCAVYTRNRHFRMLGCCKAGKAAVLAPTRRYSCAPGRPGARSRGLHARIIQTEHFSTCDASPSKPTLPEWAPLAGSSHESSVISNQQSAIWHAHQAEQLSALSDGSLDDEASSAALLE